MTAAAKKGFAAQRERLLLAFLPHVPFEGWTAKALELGCADLGLDRADALGIFPGGTAEVADAFAAYADRAMLAGLARHDVMALKVRERIHLGVRLRLEALEPWRESVRRLLSFLSLPGRAGLSLRLGWRTADAIWHAAGDTATDFNHYTKRGLLLSVYGATLLYWLGDESEGRADTWAFLDRRIADVLKIPRYGRKAREAVGRVAGPFARPFVKSFERLAKRART